jgi:hypothetical protein
MGTVLLRAQSKRLWLLGVLGGLFLLLLAGALGLWTQGDKAKVLGQAEWGNVPPEPGAAGREPRCLAIRSQQELYRALGMPGDGKTRMQLERFFTKAFNTKKVDFETRMLLLVTGGAQPSAGYRVEVTRVERSGEGQALRVYWKLHPPPPGQSVTQGPTHPAALVLLSRFNGEVSLEPPETVAEELGKPKKD